jgi:hypothetical protein
MADLYNHETANLFTNETKITLYVRIETIFRDLDKAIKNTNTDLKQQMYPRYLRATTNEVSSAFKNVENNLRTVKGKKWLAQAKTPKYNFSAQLKIVRRYIDSITPEQEHLALTIIQFQETIQRLSSTAHELELSARESREVKYPNMRLDFFTCESACNVCTKLQTLASRIGPEYVSSVINNSRGTHVLLSRVTNFAFEVRQLSALVRNMIEFAPSYAGDIIVDELNADLLELSQVGEVIQALINTLPAWDDQ